MHDPDIPFDSGSTLGANSTALFPGKLCIQPDPKITLCKDPVHWNTRSPSARDQDRQGSIAVRPHTQRIYTMRGYSLACVRLGVEPCSPDRSIVLWFRRLDHAPMSQVGASCVVSCFFTFHLYWLGHQLADSTVIHAELILSPVFVSSRSAHVFPSVGFESISLKNFKLMKRFTRNSSELPVREGLNLIGGVQQVYDVLQQVLKSQEMHTTE
ncbi:hypothetical protein C8R47DRAFT_719335 [Mycena vitilis]|nr:hypothetical protein C8R47DRAFT_719335 [Mycena vitilis]